jgi:hypothetical protein
MTVDLDALLAALKSDPAARDAIRREVLTEDLLALPGQVERLAVRTDSRFAELAEAQARTEDSLARMIARVDVMGGEVSSLLGADYEHEVLASPDGVEEAVGAAFGTVRRLTGDELTAHLSKAISEGRITPQAARDVRRANGVFVWDQGPSASPIYCVVEASVTAQARDVERAKRRAAELALTGVQTVPIILGNRPDPEIAPAIEAKQVAWQQVSPKRGVHTLTR